MIKLTNKDLRFKQLAAELMSGNLILIAVVLETIEDGWMMREAPMKKMLLTTNEQLLE